MDLEIIGKFYFPLKVFHCLHANRFYCLSTRDAYSEEKTPQNLMQIAKEKNTNLRQIPHAINRIPLKFQKLQKQFELVENADIDIALNDKVV